MAKIHLCLDFWKNNQASYNLEIGKPTHLNAKPQKKSWMKNICSMIYDIVNYSDGELLLEFILPLMFSKYIGLL